MERSHPGETVFVCTSHAGDILCGIALYTRGFLTVVMRSALLFLLLLVLPPALSAQQSMRKYDAILSLAGWYHHGTDVEEILAPDGTSSRDLSLNEISTAFRSGFFISRSVAIGAEIDWTHRGEQSEPSSNPTFRRSREVEDLLYAAPWARWYIPATNRWWFFTEASVGYAYIMRDVEMSSVSDSYFARSILDGGGVRAGLGISYLVDRRIAIDATFRYSGTWVRGRTERPGMRDADADLTSQGLDVLIGIQALL